MTNEEAKKAEKELNALLNMCNPSPLTKELEDALKMAIKALETTCIEDYPTCTECEHYDSEKHYCPRFCQVIKDTLAEAQPTEMRDATEEERKSVKDYVESISKPTGFNFYEAQPSEDCISRQKALDCFEQTNTRQGAKYAIETLPSVTPQRPKGKWIEIEIDAGEFIYKCSKCGMRVVNPYKYCPMCGSYNGGEEDE